MSIRKGTTIIAGNSSPLDWTGTLQEYNIALENGTIKENMVCYITDDTLYTDDIRPEIETLNSVKANKDLSNLSEVGEKHFLNKSQITNCITEVPQRVKYTLVDGTLTILKGSVVIVPYGTEDLTSQYPKGARFLHDNFKVYDTQFANGKFFVWAEVVSDVSRNSTGYTAINLRPIHISITENSFTGTAKHESGSEGFTGSSNCLYYHTNENLVKYYREGSLTNTVHCLPLLSCTNNENYLYAELNQVFNGMGYIGSTVWVDKGIKCLIPNGRNADGTLKNNEFTTNNLIVRTFTTSNTGYRDLFLTESTISILNSYSYDELNNLNLNTAGDVALVHTGCLVGNLSLANGVISNFQPKLPFRAVDYNDKSEISGWAMPSNKYISVTLGASDTTYTAPANGYYQCYIGGSSGNKWLRLFTTGNYLQESGFSTSNNIGFTVPIKKGETLNVRYSGTLTVKNLIFIYAEGEV